MAAATTAAMVEEEGLFDGMLNSAQRAWDNTTDAVNNFIVYDVENARRASFNAIKEKWDAAKDGEYGDALGVATNITGDWATYGGKGFLKGAMELPADILDLAQLASENLPGDRAILESRLGAVSGKIHEAAKFYELTPQENADAVGNQLVANQAAGIVGGVVGASPIAITKLAAKSSWFAAKLAAKPSWLVAKLGLSTAFQTMKTAVATSPNVIRIARIAEEATAPIARAFNATSRFFNTARTTLAPAARVASAPIRAAANLGGKVAATGAKAASTIVKTATLPVRVAAKGALQTAKLATTVGKAIAADVANGMHFLKAAGNLIKDFLLKLVTDNLITALLAGVSALAVGYLSTGGEKERKKEGFFSSAWSFVKGAVIGVGAFVVGKGLYDSLQNKNDSPFASPIAAAEKTKSAPHLLDEFGATNPQRIAGTKGHTKMHSDFTAGTGTEAANRYAMLKRKQEGAKEERNEADYTLEA